MPDDQPMAIRGLWGEIVDDRNVSVPLDEVYVHHWFLFYTTPDAGNELVGKLGTGAETRGTPIVSLTAPYAFTTAGKEKWWLNVHLLMLQNVTNVPACIQCLCAPDGRHGSFNCCPDGAHCRTTLDPFVTSTGTDAFDDPHHCPNCNSDPDAVFGPPTPGGFLARPAPKYYRVKYTVRYGCVSPIVRPVRANMIIDAVGGRHEWNVFPAEGCMKPSASHLAVAIKERRLGDSGHDDIADRCVDTKTATVLVNEDFHLIGVRAHMHIGAIDAVLAGISSNSSDTDDGIGIDWRCDMTAIYGCTPHKAGHEEGYVTSITQCHYHDGKGPMLRKGDRLQYTVRYRRDKHYGGVMGGGTLVGHFPADDGMSGVASTSWPFMNGQLSYL
ncbi:unnamed protein product [Vitrella brassicaformis CCMP3155]|uniref:Uncharacterized protein n=3 Tax=Vitrella brassicaformis TaxID=1169539 RepID=A0A0G4GPP9_VITBC|nr:unnamed protein product [Vitrella brassicaformis CCMP3155]|eukprot:CEM32331.1 unnamed protein product [Vitrella brassicaformis CCMP3155]